MKLRELLASLALVPLDAEVELSVWDNGADIADEIEFGHTMAETDIGSVTYNAETNRVFITEAS
jgi:hypothetical protein